MKIFISWSGEKSRKVGELLDDWLQCVIQAIKPWRSDKDIDSGSLWFTQITSQLEDTRHGIVCLTQDNKENPWILFESGALAKGLSSSRVCTFLIDLEPSDIKDPLAQFNHTKPTSGGLFSLLKTLNGLLGENSLSEKTLEKVFDIYWPEFERDFKKILEETKEEKVVEKRPEGDILSEILNITRGMDRRISLVERGILKKEHREIDMVYTKKPLIPSEVLESQVNYHIANGKSINEIVEILSEKYTAPTTLVLNYMKNRIAERE